MGEHADAGVDAGEARAVGEDVGAPHPVTAVRAVTTAPVSTDRQARTVEVVWSTGARAPNYVPGLGEILEELEMPPDSACMVVLRSGAAPGPNAHQRFDATSVLGRVVAARLERGVGTATLRLVPLHTPPASARRGARGSTSKAGHRERRAPPDGRECLLDRGTAPPAPLVSRSRAMPA
jgi:hypothetical protein